MPTRKSALKRMRTDREKGLANKSVRAELKTHAAKLRKIIEKGQKEDAASLFTAYSSKLDKAAKRNIIHPNKAANQKSRFSKKIASL